MVLNILSKAIWVGLLLAAFSLGHNLAWAEVLSVATPRLEIEDALGRRVVLSVPPQRIITIFPSVSELVCVLGLGDNIVGIDATTANTATTAPNLFPPGITDRPKIGGRLGVSLEQIVDQNPDMVIMAPSQQAVQHILVPPLERMGIPAVVLTSGSMAEIMSNLEKIAILTGRSEIGQALIKDMKARLAQVRQRRLGRTKPKVILITSRMSSGLFIVARKGGYMADMVELAGGVLALERTLKIIPSLPQISPEALMSVDPDIILFRLKKGSDMEEYLRRPAFSTLKAYRNGHMYAITGTEFGIPSTRAVNGVETLADIFEKWDKQQ